MNREALESAPAIKRPSFQFYPGDYLRDIPRSSCSLAARGLWMEMLCLMHECKPYGHLAIAGKPMRDTVLMNQAGCESIEELHELLAELEAHDVFSRLEDGTIYCRRMVRDEVAREKNRKNGAYGHMGKEYGKLGSRPRKQSSSSDTVTNNPQGGVNKNPPGGVNNNPQETPSSSSSSSSSSLSAVADSSTATASDDIASQLARRRTDPPIDRIGRTYPTHIAEMDPLLASVEGGPEAWQVLARRTRSPDDFFALLKPIHLGLDPAFPPPEGQSKIPLELICRAVLEANPIVQQLTPRVVQKFLEPLLKSRQRGASELSESAEWEKLIAESNSLGE